MLQASRQDSTAVHFDQFAVLIHTFADRMIGAGQQLVGSWPRETAFLGGLKIAVLVLW